MERHDRNEIGICKPEDTWFDNAHKIGHPALNHPRSQSSAALFQRMNNGMKASVFDNPQWSDVLKKINVYQPPENQRCVIFVAKNVTVGSKNQYDLLQLGDANKRTIFQTGNNKKGVGIRTTNKEMLLVVDRPGFFIHYDGTPTRTDCIEWSELFYANKKTNIIFYVFVNEINEINKNKNEIENELQVEMKNINYDLCNGCNCPPTPPSPTSTPAPTRRPSVQFIKSRVEVREQFDFIYLLGINDNHNENNVTNEIRNGISHGM